LSKTLEEYAKEIERERNLTKPLALAMKDAKLKLEVEELIVAELKEGGVAEGKWKDTNILQKVSIANCFSGISSELFQRCNCFIELFYRSFKD
jgi:hypothetical protein